MANDLTHTNDDSTTLDLADGDTYRLVEIRGVRNNPGELAKSDSVYRRPAIAYEAVNPISRNIEIDLLVLGTLGTNIETRLRALRSHFNVDRRAGSTGVLSYTDFEDKTMLIDVIPWFDDPADVGSWLIPGVSGDGWGFITIRLLAPDSTFYASSWVSDSDTFNGTTPVNLSIANAGDEDAYYDIDVGGVVTADWTIEDSYGNVLTFVTGLGGGETLDAYVHPDRKQRVFTGPGGADWRGQLGSGSRLLFAAPGTNNLTFTGGNAGDSGSIAARIHSRYSSM